MNAPATTVSLLTCPARGGIAVISLVGPDARRILEKVFRPRAGAPRRGALALGWIVAGQEVLDEAIVTVSGPPEEWAEINIHGGPHVARRVLMLLAECGAEVVADRPADPALAAGYPGLGNPAVAREMLAALPQARTPLAACAVTAQWSGGLSALTAAQEVAPEAMRAAAAALGVMRRLLCPAEVVVAGPPNVGKSALVNVLVGRGVSIVSDTPGTTRDWVRTLAEAHGVPIWLTDTAGLWQPPAGGSGAAAEQIEAEAVRRAWGRIESADLVVCVTAGEQSRDDGLLARLRRQANVLNVSGKCDLFPPGAAAGLAVSAVTLAGLDELRGAIRSRLGFDGFDPAAAMAFTDRQARLLEAAAEAVECGELPQARAALRELLRGG